MGYGVPDSGVDFFYVPVQEAYLLMKNDKAVFVDGRDTDDYERSRLQCSFHLPANTLILNKNKIDNALVKHLIELVAAGRTLIAVSDSCITGASNRGHVSRCRHVAQYLVELGADRRNVMRMRGGINAWKAAGLDGVIGDHRPMFAGVFQAGDFTPPQPEEDEEETDSKDDRPPVDLAALVASAEAGSGSPTEDGSPQPVELSVGCTVKIDGLKSRADLNNHTAKVLQHIEDAGRWEVEMLDASFNKERVRCKSDNLSVLSAGLLARRAPDAADHPTITIVCGGDTRDGSRVTCEVRVVPPRLLQQDKPTSYRVLKGEVYKKPSIDSDKIIKLERPVSALVRTTGEVFEGANGGKWAELDVTAGEKKGWAYIEGPGFGPSSRKIRTEFLRA